MDYERAQLMVLLAIAQKLGACDVDINAQDARVTLVAAAQEREFPVTKVEAELPILVENDENIPGAAYVTVATFTVPAGRRGFIEELSLDASAFANAQWRLTVGTFRVEGLIILGATDFVLRVEAPSGSVLSIEALTTGAAFTAYGLITGRHYP